MTHLVHLLGRGGLRQRRPGDEIHLPRRELQPTAAGPTGCSRVNPLTPEQIARGGLPGLFPLPRWEIIQPGEYFRAFERGGRPPALLLPRDRQSQSPRGAGQAGHPTLQPRPGHRSPHQPGVLNIHKTRLNDPAPLVPRHQRPSRRLPLERLHRLPRRLRERPRSGALRSLGRRSATTGRRPRQGPDDPEGTSPAIPIEHSFTRADPDQPVHVLPHAPAELVREHLPRLQDVGLRDRRPGAVARRSSATPTAAERRARASTATPKGAAVRGLWTDPEFLAKVAS